MASTNGDAAPGFTRTEFHNATKSQCDYCEIRFIGPLRMVEDWEKQHRKKCRKPQGVSA